MFDPKPYQRYTRRIAVICISVLAAIIGISLVSDSFGIYNMPIRVGFNQYKPAYDFNVRISKGQMISHASHYEGVVLGSSTAEIGLNPEHPGWKGPAFNLAISAGNMLEARNYLREAIAHNPIRQVVLQADYLMFQIHSGVAEDAFDHTVFGNSFADQALMYAKTLMTQYALRTAIRNMRRSAEAVERDLDVPYQQNGQRGHRYFEYKLVYGGHRKVFRDVVLEYLSSSLTGKIHHYAYVSPETGASSIAYFKDIVALCAEHNIALSVVLTPVHAQMMLMYSEAGYMDSFDALMKKQSTILAAANEAQPGTFTLWDFSTPSRYTTETIPPEGDMARMNYYWDPVHYSNTLGMKLLDSVFAAKPVDGFGTVVTPRNVDAVIKNRRLKIAAYKKSHADEYAEVKQRMEEAKSARDSLIIEMP